MWFSKFTGKMSLQRNLFYTLYTLNKNKNEPKKFLTIALKSLGKFSRPPYRKLQNIYRKIFLNYINILLLLQQIATLKVRSQNWVPLGLCLQGCTSPGDSWERSVLLLEAMSIPWLTVPSCVFKTSSSTSILSHIASL